MTKQKASFLIAFLLLPIIVSAVVVVAKSQIDMSSQPESPSPSPSYSASPIFTPSNSHMQNPSSTPIIYPTPFPTSTPLPSPSPNQEPTITTFTLEGIIYRKISTGPHDKVLVFLGGGSWSAKSIGIVEPHPWDLSPAPNDIYQTFDVINLGANALYWVNATTWVGTLARTLSSYYSKLFLVGASGGGIVVLNELIKSNQLWTGAAVLDTPCAGIYDADGTKYFNPIFNTIQNASQVRVPTLFVTDLQDAYREDMVAFYNLTPARKELRSFYGPHYAAASNPEFYAVVDDFFLSL